MSTGPQQGDLFDREIPPWEIDAECQCWAASIVFSEPPHGPFSYRIEADLQGKLKPGMRVRVPLGRGNRSVTGYCVDVSMIQQHPDSLKAVICIEDEQPLCSNHLLKLMQWMSDYYLASLGQVFEAVVPVGVRESAGVKEVLHLQPKSGITVEEIEKLTSKQRQVVDYLMQVGEPMSVEQLKAAVGCSADILQRLRKSGVLESHSVRSMTPLPSVPSHILQPPAALNVDQRQALQQVKAAVDSRQQQTILLHGITGSGKTEVYIQAIEYVIRFGLQAIVLVPEISLTPQTRARFQQRLGKIAVLHSHMTHVERHQQWQRIAAGEVSVVIGPRSAIFAPVPKLGLIVLDEEHEPSFKQETIPRYHARDVALQRAMLEQCTVILGSATPSLESWQRSVDGKYQCASMPRRIHNRPLPDVEIIDLRLQKLSPQHGSISRPLAEAIVQTVKDDGQVILLLNRRGFATAIQCPKCGSVANCPHCDLALTYHQEGNKAICHYCDYQVPTPQRCWSCDFDAMQYGGTGTQRLEEEVKRRFPNLTMARMDSDTMRKPGSHERVLTAFRNGEIQLLLGTQMIAKGLDFPNVLLVGVVNADTALHFPDFRAAERTFQLVTQVAGRTGRGERRGLVLVQTYSPEHPAIMAASKHDFQTFAQGELVHRQRLSYPPWGSLARVIFRGELAEKLEAFAMQWTQLTERLIEQSGAHCRLLGPAPPPIAKLRGKYRQHLLMQANEPKILNRILRHVSAEIKTPEDIQWVIDIDPIDML
jgi:primosomal protein N' (replication factor Y) (superfamily II helicase)